MNEPQVTQSDVGRHDGFRKGPTLDKSFLLEAIVYDLHMSCLHVGLLFRALSSSTLSHSSESLRTWKHVLFDDSAMMVLGLRYATALGLDAHVSAQIEALYARLTKLKSGIERALNLRAPTPVLNDGELRKLTAGARELAVACVALLENIEPCTRRCLLPIHASNGKELVRYLSSMLREDGMRCASPVEAPRLARRTSPRLSVNRACTVFSSNNKISAFIYNISATGLAMECEQLLPLNEPVIVVTADNRSMRAVPIWQEGGSIGLKMI